MKIKVMLVDDHAVVLKGLYYFLATQPDIELVGEAANGKEALDKIAVCKPDVVMMDLMMPEMNGIEATAEVRRRFPDVKVIVLTTFADHDHVLPAVRAGASGYLLKDVQPDELVRAIKGVYDGQVQLHPKATEQIMAHMSSPLQDGSVPAVSELTARELEVLRLIAQGRSNKEIAADMNIAEKTVKTHVSHILSKLGLQDRTQAAVFAVKNGLT